MTTITLPIPDALYSMIDEIATRERISFEQFVMLAIAEKAYAAAGKDYLEKRARRGSREKFLAVMAKVPDVEPEEYDRLPAPVST